MATDRWQQFGIDYPEILAYLLGQVSHKFVADHRLMDLITLVNSLPIEDDSDSEDIEAYALRKRIAELEEGIRNARIELFRSSAWNTEAYKYLDVLDKAEGADKVQDTATDNTIIVLNSAEETLLRLVARKPRKVLLKADDDSPSDGLIGYGFIYESNHDGYLYITKAGEQWLEEHPVGWSEWSEGDNVTIMKSTSGMGYDVVDETHELVYARNTSKRRAELLVHSMRRMAEPAGDSLVVPATPVEESSASESEPTETDIDHFSQRVLENGVILTDPNDPYYLVQEKLDSHTVIGYRVFRDKTCIGGFGMNESAGKIAVQLLNEETHQLREWIAKLEDVIREAYRVATDTGYETPALCLSYVIAELKDSIRQQ